MGNPARETFGRWAKISVTPVRKEQPVPGSDRQKVAARSSFARAIRPMVLFGKSSQGLIFVGSGRSHRPVGHQNVIAVESQAVKRLHWQHFACRCRRLRSEDGDLGRCNNRLPACLLRATPQTRAGSRCSSPAARRRQAEAGRAPNSIPTIGGSGLCSVGCGTADPKP